MNYWDRHSGSTALSATSYIGSLSVVRDHLKVVRALLNYQGVRANIQNNHGSTALIKASFNGHSELVQALLNHDGVYVNIQDDYMPTSRMMMATQVSFVHATTAMWK